MLLFIVVFLTCSVSFANSFNTNTDSGDNVANVDNTGTYSTNFSNGGTDSNGNSSNSSTGSNVINSNDNSSDVSSNDLSNSSVSSNSSNAQTSTSVNGKTNGLVAEKPTKLSQSAIFKASITVRNYVNKNGKLPNSVTISGVKFSMPEYMYLVSRAITLKYLKSSSSVTIIWNVKNPSKLSGSKIKKKVSKSMYYDWAKRTYKFIAKNKAGPNFINSKFGKIQYQTVIFGFSKFGAYISTHNKIPLSLALNVKKASKLNKNKPFFTRTPTSNNLRVLNTKYNLTANKNGIWVHSGDMDNVNLALLTRYGIKNIFIHEDIFNKRDQAINWIKSSSAKGFKIHIWFSTFFNATSKKWTNPIVNGKLNQKYFNKVISRAKYYASIEGVAGIHLDYVRYPGSSSNKASIFTYENRKKGADAITEFARQLSEAVKPINNEIVLSAALMPEKDLAATYYGQNATELGKYLNILIPMVYKGNYKSSTAWIKSTINWYTKNSGGAEVWGGLYGYYSDTNLNRLSVSELKIDSKSVLNGGGTGIVIFRWRITNLFNLLSIK